MNPKVITTAAGIETLFQQAGAATVQAAILQPALQMKIKIKCLRSLITNHLMI